MKDSKPPIRDAAEQAVSEAWQALPQAEPSAGLDARVRAGVAAILEAENDGSAPRAEVVRFPAWRRAAAPVAIAATMVLAFGVSHLWMQDEGGFAPAPAPAPAPVSDANEAPLIAAAPQASGEQANMEEAAKPAVPVAKAEPRAARERVEGKRESQARIERARQKEDVESRRAAEQLADARVVSKPAPAAASVVPLAAAPAPFSPIAPAPAPAPVAARRDAGALQPGVAAKTTDSARMQSRSAAFAAAPAVEAAPAVSAPASAAPPPPVPERSLAENVQTPTLTMVRDALRDGRRDDAKSAWKRWREAHPQAEVPDDLRALAAEVDVEVPAR
jgi:hypothetical protein